MAGELVSREALERIIQRAAELQASERDLSEGLTEAELFQLGQDVGLSAASVKRALIEERTRVAAPERGVGRFLAGPRRVTAERILPLAARATEDALRWWMDEGEVLQVKRRFPGVTVWEARRGALAAMRRSFKGGGRSHQLARVRDVHGSVTDLGDGRCHVRMVADVTNQRAERIGWGTVLFGAGAVTTVAAIGIGVDPWAAVLATGLGGLFGYGVARSQWQEAARVQLALEQVLDRLEHGEIQPTRQIPGPRASAFARIASEIRRTFET
jgi:hypothetical protein